MPTEPRKRFSLVELDRSDVVVTMLVAAAVVVGAAVVMVRRVAELLGDGPVPVRVELTGDEVVRAPLGPGGADVTATAGSVVVDVPHLAGLARAAALVEAVAMPTAFAVTAVCLALFCRRVVRGLAFTAATTRLVLVACLATLVAWLVQVGASVVVGGAARSALGGGDPGSGTVFVTAFPLGLLLVAIALGAVAGAMRVGERLQRDTEGLV
ncbi:hypothetical protein [Cellulosimicrobium protaetiae]|uniref:DUF2975 domain-containing protein n=1 Tax=Cellulosimicrobium protaetiae TaxID=2587808 RepID=A0A6M5UIX2_9MICO|nr:hypothetical protein [Cellulosimicrobium protaetiae]QJW37492.1 hypothetical protein FIC82_016190 [Cellulosimicrobium protaetiae]